MAGSTRDGDGDVDGAGQAVIEAVWSDLAGAALCGRLGRRLCGLLATLNSRFDEPPAANQYEGWHQYVDKDLRALLGRRVAGRYRTRFCGNGSIGACARSLWSALDAAGRAEAARQGTSDPAQWRLATKRLAFTPLALVDLQYTNRPSGIHRSCSSTVAALPDEQVLVEGAPEQVGLALGGPAADRRVDLALQPQLDAAVRRPRRRRC